MLWQQKLGQENSDKIDLRLSTHQLKAETIFYITITSETTAPHVKYTLVNGVC